MWGKEETKWALMSRYGVFNAWEVRCLQLQVAFEQNRWYSIENHTYKWAAVKTQNTRGILNLNDDLAIWIFDPDKNALISQ